MADQVASDAQLSFKVKTAGDKSHTIAMEETATVLDLKRKLAGEEYENIPVERQRLIYSGRVMKNDDALSVYKIKTGNTIHMVKSAASNPAPAPPAAASAPSPPAVPQNMAAGTAANNLLAGLTGARFAGHANLPSRDMFGADGGMGAPPNEDQMADLLSNPAVAQTMNEALNNPAFVDQMIQSNPMLANMPNAREMIQSPYFRHMMTNPEALRMAARMRRMMGGGGAGQAAFPAPGATDTTPAGAPASDGAAGGNANNNNNQNIMDQQNAFANPFGIPPSFFPPGGAAGAENPFAALFGANPFAAPVPGAGASGTAAPGNTPASPTTGASPSSPAAAGDRQAEAAQANPFAALFGGMQGVPGAGGAGGANPFALPHMNPEAWRQTLQMMGIPSPEAAAPPDNRPPEDRYADQLRQLNDMGFIDFDRNVEALRRSGGSVQGAIEHLLGGS